MGSKTPPMPTPPDKCTFLPICAQLPTVAQVSTIVPLSTYAPRFTKDGIKTTPGAIYADLRTTQLGTARNPAVPHSSAPQPFHLLSTLSHQLPSWALPPCSSIFFSRKPRRTAFLAHWFTCQSPLSCLSATRNEPLSRASNVASMAPRISPVVVGEISSRASHAASMAFSNCNFDIKASD